MVYGGFTNQEPTLLLYSVVVTELWLFGDVWSVSDADHHVWMGICIVNGSFAGFKYFLASFGCCSFFQY